MKRITALILAILLLLLPVVSCTEQTVYQKEENTGRDKDSYPYIIRMPSAVWYLAKADIELLGQDAYYEGLYAVLDDAEADFADARGAGRIYSRRDSAAGYLHRFLQQGRIVKNIRRILQKSV